VSEWVSEWLLFNANSAMFFAILWWEQVNFRWADDEVRFVLDQHAELDFFIVLAHWNNSPQVDMSLHLDTLFWLRTNRGTNTRSTALEASTLTITPLMRLSAYWNIIELAEIEHTYSMKIFFHKYGKQSISQKLSTNIEITGPQSNRKIVERCIFDISNIHDTWLLTFLAWYRHNNTWPC
jgi:hypothetical protein